MMMLPKIVATAAALLLVTGALAGCSNGAENPSDNTKSGATKIGLLLPDSITARYDGMDRPIFEAKIKELCATCEVLYANADADAAKQQQQAESMITQGAKVLVLDPFDSKAAAAIVAAATAKKVPVIAYDRLINSKNLSYYISFDNEKVGALQGQAFVDELKAKGVKPGDGGVLMANGSATDNNALLFKAGAHKIIDPSGYKVLAEFDDWDPTKTQNWVAGQLTQFKSQLRGVYSANDNNAGAAIAAMRAVGINPLPPVTGQDAELAGIQRILSGDQFMTIYKALRVEAEQAATLAVALSKGEKPTAPSTIAVDGTKVPAYLLDPVVVTIANIQDTILKDKFYTVAQICTADFKAACDKANLK